MSRAAGWYVGRDARQHAQRKARYGRRNWLVWTNQAGERCCAPVTRESLKAALLAHGTQGGDMVLIHQNCGSGQFLGWAGAMRLRVNLRYFQ